jgi:hypothetical protein
MRTKKIIAWGVIFLLASAISAFAQGTPKSKTVLNAEVSSSFPDQNTGAITPAIQRSALNDLIASWQQAPQVNAQIGTTYTFLASDYGQFVTFNNVGSVAVTLPQATGSFSPWNTFTKNLGAGTVTITPQGGSTINGASTLVLSQNQSAWITSDSVNYQTLPSGGSGTINSGTTNQLAWYASSGTAVSGLSTANNGVLVTSSGGVPSISTTLPSGIAATNMALTTPTLGVATATSINKMAVTAPATSSTLAVANGKTFTASNTLTLTGTDSSSIALGTGGTVTYTIASGATALATSAILSGACTAAQTATATGTLTTDAIIASFNGDPTAATGYVPLTTGMLTIIVYPTANAANFKVCNLTSSSITPGAVTLNWRVVR